MTPRVRPARVTAALARGKYPVPSRTRKSSLSAPMVLQPGGCGRVGRRRTILSWRPPVWVASTCLTSTPTGRAMANEGRGAGPRRGGDPRRPAAGGSRGSSDRGTQGSRGRSGASAGQGAGRRASGSEKQPFSRSRRDDRRPGAQERPRSTDQATYDGPPIDEKITGKELDRSVSQQLRGLPDKLAARVARHLVAAGLAMGDDPETAYQHALAARARAARIAVVREACGE